MHAAIFNLEKQDFAAAENLTNDFIKANKVPRRELDTLKSILLIINYLRADLAHCEKAIPLLTKSLETKALSLDPSDILGMYVKFLASIFTFRHANPDLYSAAAEKNIYMIGDSHCLSPAYVITNNKNSAHQIIPKLIFGTKAWHFHRRSYKTRLDGFKNIIESIPNGSTIFLSFGEIDCRINEGIFSHYLKNPDSNLEKISKLWSMAMSISSTKL